MDLLQGEEVTRRCKPLRRFDERGEVGPPRVPAIGEEPVGSRPEHGSLPRAHGVVRDTGVADPVGTCGLVDETLIGEDVEVDQPGVPGERRRTEVGRVALAVDVERKDLPERRTGGGQPVDEVERLGAQRADVIAPRERRRVQQHPEGAATETVRSCGNQFRSAVDVRLGEDRLQVVAHGVHRDRQFVGDLLRADAPADEQHDLGLAVGEPVRVEQDRNEVTGGGGVDRHRDRVGITGHRRHVDTDPPAAGTAHPSRDPGGRPTRPRPRRRDEDRPRQLGIQFEAQIVQHLVGTLGLRQDATAGVHDQHNRAPSAQRLRHVDQRVAQAARWPTTRRLRTSFISVDVNTVPSQRTNAAMARHDVPDMNATRNSSLAPRRRVELLEPRAACEIPVGGVGRASRPDRCSSRGR